MSLPILFQSVMLLVTAIFTFIWVNNPELSKFSLQLAGLLVMIYFFHSWLNQRQQKKEPHQNPYLQYRNITNTIILVLITLLLVLSTGGIISPFFFLVYFLLFGISLFLHPRHSWLLSLALIVLFVLNGSLTSNTALINLVSLLFITPLAQLFGNQYIQVLNDKQHIKALNRQSKRLDKDITKHETTTLLWLSIEFRNKVHQAIDIVSQLLSSLNNIPYHQRDQLSQVHQNLKDLAQSGQEVKEKIDNLTDENR